MSRIRCLTVIGLVVLTLPSLSGAQGPVDTLRSFSANSGLYDNRIISMTPPNDYTEVCFKNGALTRDPHVGGQPTDGGNCLVGDVGWVIEQNERNLGAGRAWDDARAECLFDGMRLPEPFEFKVSCKADDFLSLNGLDDQNFEWASNFAAHQSDADSATNSVGVVNLGGTTCSTGSWGLVATTGPFNEGSFAFRCVR